MVHSTDVQESVGLVLLVQPIISATLMDTCGDVARANVCFDTFLTTMLIADLMFQLTLVPSVQA